MRTRSIPAPGLRPVLLAILIVMALMADTRIASAALGGAEQGVAAPGAGKTPFDRQGMWIWYVDRSDGGDGRRILARARNAGIGTLYIKAGDAGHVWPQFNKTLVGALHQGDLVVWAQEHLQAAGQPQLPVTGIFGRQTRAAVRAFQASSGLPVDGAIGTMTWGSLLDFDPVRPRWAGRRAKRVGGATASRAFPPRRPLSASLPAKAYEIDPGPAP